MAEYQITIPSFCNTAYFLKVFFKATFSKRSDVALAKEITVISDSRTEIGVYSYAAKYLQMQNNFSKLCLTKLNEDKLKWTCIDLRLIFGRELKCL